MKKFLLLLLAIFLSLLTISCSNNTDAPVEETLSPRDQELSERVIADKITINDGMAYKIADDTTLEAVTEISTQIIQCRIEKQNSVKFNDIAEPIFRYDVVVEEVFLDSTNMIEKGDTIEIASSNGLIKGSDYASISKNSMHARKFGYDKKVYAENEYILCSAFGSIPYEVGKTYIVYLTDRYYNDAKLFADVGRNYNREYTDGVIYSGVEYKKERITYDSYIAQLKKDVQNRSGRVDEVGVDQYLAELGERQYKEYLAKEQPLQKQP